MPRFRLIQFRTGTKAAILASAASTFAPGEPIYSSDSNELFLSNGILPAVPVSRSYNGVGNPASGNVLMPFGLATFAAASLTSGALNCVPIDVWPRSLSITGLVCNVTTAQSGGTATLVRVGLYADNGSGSGPLLTAAGLLASATVTATTTGVKTNTITTMTLQPGRYWATLFYYAGTTAPTTVPAFTTATVGNSLWTTTAAFGTVVKSIGIASGLTALPTSGTAVPLATNPGLVGLLSNGVV